MVPLWFGQGEDASPLEDGGSTRARRPFWETAWTVPREKGEDAVLGDPRCCPALVWVPIGDTDSCCDSEMPEGLLGMWQSRPRQTRLPSQPRVPHRASHKSKQIKSTLATKLLPINPRLPAVLRKKPFFFSIDQR